MSWEKVQLGKILTESRIPCDNPDPDRRIKVKLKVQGVEKRGLESEIEGATRQFIRRAGQFIYGKQNFHKGAFGIIPKELDGFESSADLPAFDVSENCLPEWIFYHFKQGNYYLELSKIARGVATQRIHPEQIYELEIPLPDLKTQKVVLQKILSLEEKGALIDFELAHQLTLVKKLRQQLLQDAVQGKLVAQDFSDEPASELLRKIKAEKETLRQAQGGKSAKKEKELPPIKPEEIPFDIPENWVWCRLGEICNTITKGSSPSWQGVQYVSENKGILFITSKNVDSFKIDLTKATYVEEKFNEIEPRSILKNGDLLTNIVGASIGRTALFDLDVIANINQAVCILRIEHTLINKDYLLNLMNSDFAIKLMFETQFAPGRANLSMGNIASFTIPIPPLSEQTRIVQKLDELMQYCNELEASIKASQEQNEKLLQQVLREALSPHKNIRGKKNIGV